MAETETLEQWRDMAIRLIKLNDDFAAELKMWMDLAKKLNTDENERLKAALQLIVNHPVEKTGKWEIAVKEIKRLAQSAINGDKNVHH